MPQAPLDPEYYHDHSQAQYEFAQEVLNTISFKGDEAILDIGCGEGKITAWLAQQVLHGLVIGVDISEEMINYAKKHYSAPNLTFSIGNACSLPWEGAFDWIFAFSCFHWVHPKQEAFAAIKQALKPGGKCSIITFPRDSAYFYMLREVMELPNFKSFRYENETPSIEEYQIFVEEKKFSDYKINVDARIASYDGPTELRNYVRGWLPSLLPLPPTLKEPFLDEVVAASSTYRIEKADNKIHIPFNLITICLKK